jgi:phosphoadenosine phosphosulfate reductase
MYSYTYSAKTGGLLLNSTPTGLSKEPRPVYAPELNLLGFNKYWQYDNQNDAPYMWAEANRYYYRGRLVAALFGGDVYHEPIIQLAYICSEWRETPSGKATAKIVCENPEDRGETFTDKKGNLFTLDLPEPGGKLRPVDITAMIDDNREILGWLEETTAKKILDVYEKYVAKLDIFHVAFSGGKDSCVLLDLVKSVLPQDSFVVVFGDTGMEFPDTYDVIDKVEAQCKKDGVKFYRASSHFSPAESWDLFAPPSRVLRWCCSVHKSTPQTLKLREVTGKRNYTGLAYVGVRAEESATRSEYEYENNGKKIKGQYSHNSILEWTSAEVWLYIYAHNVIINEAYKRGSSRVGCLCCPMGGGKSAYVELKNYPDEVKLYFDKIKKSNGRKTISGEDYISKGGWNARKNGRDIANNPMHYFEKTNKDEIVIEAEYPSSSLAEWAKTLREDEKAQVTMQETDKGFVITYPESLQKSNPLLSRLVRQVARKAAYCKGCKVCQANCPNECISFENGAVKIDGCLHCKECHQIDSGCLLYHSLRHPQGGGIIMKSLNTMSNHAPKTEWFKNLFEKGNDFFGDHGLGPEQISFFKRFLKNAGIADRDSLLPFADIIISLGWDSDTAMGLIYINLVNENPTIEWYVNNLEVGKVYDRKTVENMLINFDVKPPVAKSICGAFKRLTETPLGTKLNFGYVSDDGDLARTVCSIGDSRVILYALYKFAEKCNDYKEFTLNALLSDNIERDGVSPTRIFGLNREAMIPLLIGLSGKYPEFINATFTNDLDKISLQDDKTSEDVLELFKEGN